MNEIKTKQIGEVRIASDGEFSALATSQEEAIRLIKEVELDPWQVAAIPGDAFKEPPEQEHPFHPKCPSCGGKNTMMIHGGDFQCLDCFHRWNTKLLDNL